MYCISCKYRHSKPSPFSISGRAPFSPDQPVISDPLAPNGPIDPLYPWEPCLPPYDPKAPKCYDVFDEYAFDHRTPASSFISPMPDLRPDEEIDPGTFIDLGNPGDIFQFDRGGFSSYDTSGGGGSATAAFYSETGHQAYQQTYETNKSRCDSAYYYSWC